MDLPAALASQRRLSLAERISFTRALRGPVLPQVRIARVLVRLALHTDKLCKIASPELSVQRYARSPDVGQLPAVLTNRFA